MGELLFLVLHTLILSTKPCPQERPGPLPRPVLTVVGLNAFHTMVSQMLVAMKREIPEPRPYPFCRSSSKSKTIKPATKSCENLKRKEKNKIKQPTQTAVHRPVPFLLQYQAFLLLNTKGRVDLGQ